MKQTTVWLGLALAVSPLPATAGVIGSDDRLPIADYAAQHAMETSAARQRFGASGRIMCPFGEASAFLVERNDIVVTARHVLFPEKQMHPYAGRMSIHRCGFELSDGATSVWYAVDVGSFTFLDEKQRSVQDRFDWVVMKLETRAEHVTPYRLPDRPPAVGDDIQMVTIRQDGLAHQDWNERLIANCSIRGIEAIDGKTGSGIRSDCSASFGASGAALLRDGAEGLEVVGIASSATPSCPRFDLRSCFSFAVGMYDDVRKAVRSLAGGP